MWRVIADLLRDIVSYGGVARDPLYVSMQEALKKVQEGNLGRAKGLLEQRKHSLGQRTLAYKAHQDKVPHLVEIFEDLSLQFEVILKAREAGEIEKAIAKFIEIMDKNTREIEQDIGKIQ